MTKITHRIGPAPFISVDECGNGDLVILLHGIGGNKTGSQIWRVSQNILKQLRGMQEAMGIVTIMKEN